MRSCARMCICTHAGYTFNRMHAHAPTCTHKHKYTHLHTLHTHTCTHIQMHAHLHQLLQQHSSNLAQGLRDALLGGRQRRAGLPIIALSPTSSSSSSSNYCWTTSTTSPAPVVRRAQALLPGTHATAQLCDRAAGAGGCHIQHHLRMSVHPCVHASMHRSMRAQAQHHLRMSVCPCVHACTGAPQSLMSKLVPVFCVCMLVCLSVYLSVCLCAYLFLYEGVSFSSACNLPVLSSARLHVCQLSKALMNASVHNLLLSLTHSSLTGLCTNDPQPVHAQWRPSHGPCCNQSNSCTAA